MKSSSIAFVILLATAFDAHASDVTVEIKKFLFEPKEITVPPGAKVVFINRDETPHQIKADDGSFVSKVLDTDDRHEQVFATEGDFRYVCTLHPFMTGVIHVHK